MLRMTTSTIVDCKGINYHGWLISVLTVEDGPFWRRSGTFACL